MCLQTIWKKPKIAKTNKTVYKVMYIYGAKEASSQFSRFKYFLNQLYTCDIKEIDDNCSYDDIALRWKNDLRIEYKSIGEGFHSFYKKRMCDDMINVNNLSFYKCIIPKGSKYYEDGTGLVVSNQIIIKKRL